jgi:hypothetical protein
MTARPAHIVVRWRAGTTRARVSLCCRSSLTSFGAFAERLTALLTANDDFGLKPQRSSGRHTAVPDLRGTIGENGRHRLRALTEAVVSTSAPARELPKSRATFENEG